MKAPEPSGSVPEFAGTMASLEASVTQKTRLPLKTIVWLVGINLLWGGSTFAAKTAMGSALHPAIPPLTLAFTRFSCAALLLYAVARALNINLAVSRRDWGRFWVMGAIGLALTYLLSYAGIQHTSVSDASLLIATEPVFLAVLAFVFLKEKMPAAKIAGISAGILGVYLIVNEGIMPRSFTGMAAGDLLITLGMVFEAGSSILGKGLVARYPAISVITYQMLSGAVMLAPFTVLELLKTPHMQLTHAFMQMNVILSVAYLVLPCTVLAYTVWFTILDKREAGEMSVFLFLQPVVGTLLGAWVYHDAVTRFTLIGAALALLGIWLINRRPALLKVPMLPPAV